MKFVKESGSVIRHSGYQKRIRIYRAGICLPVLRCVSWVFVLFMGVGVLTPMHLAAVSQAQEPPRTQTAPSPAPNPLKPSQEGVVPQPQQLPAPQPLPPSSPTPDPLKPPPEGVAPQAQQPSAAQPLPPMSPAVALQKPAKDRLITLDFNNVDLPVFVKFVS